MATNESEQPRQRLLQLALIAVGVVGLAAAARARSTGWNQLATRPDATPAPGDDSDWSYSDYAEYSEYRPQMSKRWLDADRVSQDLRSRALRSRPLAVGAVTLLAGALIAMQLPRLRARAAGCA